MVGNSWLVLKNRLIESSHPKLNTILDSTFIIKYEY